MVGSVDEGEVGQGLLVVCHSEEVGPVGFDCYPSLSHLMKFETLVLSLNVEPLGSFWWFFRFLDQTRVAKFSWIASYACKPVTCTKDNTTPVNLKQIN